MSSHFIVIEGINGSGKSTQTNMLAKYYTDSAEDVLVVREPGGSVIGEKIRDLLRLAPEDIHVNAQIAMFLAARAQLALTIIEPALNEGKIVVSDRWITSTLVYQGYALGGMSADDILQLAALLLNGITPDATIILDVPVAAATDRRTLLKGDQQDRFEKKGFEFQQALHMGYQTVGGAFPKHQLVDGLGTPEQVHQRVIAAVESILTSEF